MLVARLPIIAQGYDHRRSPLAFLKGILKNGYIDNYRKERLRRDLSLPTPRQNIIYDTPSDLIPLLQEYLDPALIDIAKRRFIDGEGIDSIAQSMNRKSSYVKARVARARKRLVECLS